MASFAPESPTGREFCMSDTLGELVNWEIYVHAHILFCHPLFFIVQNPFEFCAR